MSTILKALEKNQNTSSMLTAGTIEVNKLALLYFIIATLIVTVCILLFKPFESKVKEPSPVAIAVEKKEELDLVTTVIFDTKPLPVVAKVIQVKKKVVKQAPLIAEKAIVDAPVEEDFKLNNTENNLLARFNRAVELEKTTEENPVNEHVATGIDISLMPAKFQYQVPLMRYDAHMYSSKKSDRWIRINGIELHEGDFLEGIELLEILPQKSLFKLNEKQFTLISLEDWKG